MGFYYTLHVVACQGNPAKMQKIGEMDKTPMQNSAVMPYVVAKIKQNTIYRKSIFRDSLLVFKRRWNMQRWNRMYHTIYCIEKTDS